MYNPSLYWNIYILAFYIVNIQKNIIVKFFSTYDIIPFFLLLLLHTSYKLESSNFARAEWRSCLFRITIQSSTLRQQGDLMIFLRFHEQLFYLYGSADLLRIAATIRFASHIS